MLVQYIAPSPKQVLSLILCWGLHASAETGLKEDALNADELSADNSLGDLEDAFDDGQDEPHMCQDEF